MLRKPGIIAANLDGTHIRTLANDDLAPTSVIVDDILDAVIWSSYDEYDAKVPSIALDGTQRGVFMYRKTNRFPVEPRSVALFENHLYVADGAAEELKVACQIS